MCESRTGLSRFVHAFVYLDHGPVGLSQPGANRLLAAREADRHAQVESFNGTVRAECLDVHRPATLTEAKQVIGPWRREYNESRPPRSWENERRVSSL